MGEGRGCVVAERQVITFKWVLSTITQKLMRGTCQMGSGVVGLIARLGCPPQLFGARQLVHQPLNQVGTLTKPPRLMEIHRGGCLNITISVNTLTETVVVTIRLA